MEMLHSIYEVGPENSDMDCHQLIMQIQDYTILPSKNCPWAPTHFALAVQFLEASLKITSWNALQAAFVSFTLPALLQ
jgi:hypothetical protein